MPGLMGRIRGRRDPAGAEQPTEVAPALPGDEPGRPLPPSAADGAHAADGAATAEATGVEVPAGADPADVLAPARPGFRDRGRLRRRLRYLRRLRELAFRDLGGLVFDLHRFGRERDDLVRVKLEALGAIDAELRALELALDDVHPLQELREPGIAACPRCGTLHGSEARFCPSCGLEREGGDMPAPAVRPADAVAVPDEQPVAEG
jgi:hypothetical protein